MPDPARTRQARTIRVGGTVQGVGFRPFVYRVASRLGLDGTVRNVDGEVLIEAAGPPAALDQLAEALRNEAPRHAVVRTLHTVTAAQVPAVGSGFAVLDSTTAGGTPGCGDLPVDLATCDACVRELFDPTTRRYRYPFINCTDCGPRATIVDDLPYDRARTAMHRFPLCPACAGEYGDPADRRFHAEPVACADCGPRLSWSGTETTGEEALAAAVALVADGGTLAVKGLGGYQLVCDAANPTSVGLLRERKHRPRKPFAVMVGDLTAAGALGRLGPAERALLTSPARPIVLVPARPGSLADRVHPGAPTVGLFLPYTPLHHLLLHALDRPLVVTSGNRADEPIAIDDRDAQRRLAGIADGFLTHDRPIRARYDDSVTQVVGGAGSVVRRARGYAPDPLPLPVAAAVPVLAVGAQLKHTFTLATGGRAVVGPHGGDLADAEALDAFHSTIAHLSRLHRLTPTTVAHDLHPGYLSTQYAATWPVRQRCAVQHHHAHVVSCAAEHGLTGPFLGLAYDGLGLGDDGTLWGGELLLASYTGYRRLARFATAPLPGTHGDGLPVRPGGPRSR